MKRLFMGLVTVVATLSALETESIFENSNFTLSTPLDGDGKRVLVNYNRFRVTEHLSEGDWFVTAIGDVENYLGQDYVESFGFQLADEVRADVPFETQSGRREYGEGEAHLELYRLYGGYANAKHRITLGLQRISMGVGRIWNPTDLFNPTNPLALEPDEVYGVFAAAYTYALGDLSEVTAVAARQEDGKAKYAGRFKSYLEVADVAFNVIRSDAVDLVGYELEGEWFETGVEVRSEGGWFEDKVIEEAYFRGLVGADYAFENRLTLAVEWLYSSQEVLFSEVTPLSARHYGGVSGSYEFDPLTTGTLTIIANADDGSYYWTPNVTYSLSDDASVGVGALIYGGGGTLGEEGETYYFNWKVTF